MVIKSAVKSVVSAVKSVVSAVKSVVTKKDTSSTPVKDFKIETTNIPAVEKPGVRVTDYVDGSSKITVGNGSSNGGSTTYYSPTGKPTTSEQLRNELSKNTEIQKATEQANNRKVQTEQTNNKGFTGQVEVRNAQGILEQQQYILQNKNVGNINYNPRRVGSQGNYQVYDVSPENVYADVKKNVNFKFGKREVNLNKDTGISFADSSLQDWAKENPTEKLVLDKQGNVIGVQSGLFQQSMSLDNYNKRIDAYNKKVNNEQPTNNPTEVSKGIINNVLGSTKDIIVKLVKAPVNLGLYITDELGYISKIKYVKGKGLLIPAGTTKITDKFGKRLKDWSRYDYNIHPWKDPNIKTLAKVDAIVLGAYGASTLGVSKKVISEIGGFVFSKPITKVMANTQDLLLPSQNTGFVPSGIPRQVGRGLLIAGSALIPGVGVAYAKEAVTGFVKSPGGSGKDFINYAKENPYELGTTAIFGTSTARNYKLNKKSSNIVQNNIRELNELPLKELSFIRKGKGTKLNFDGTLSDRIEIFALQESVNGVRKIQISGDLLNIKGKVYLLPEANGISTTISLAKPSRFAKTRIYQDVQTFKVGGKSTGIPIGNIGDIQIFTPMGTSTFIPGMGVSALVKKKFGLFAETRTLNKISNELNKNKVYGGYVIKDVTLPFNQLGFKINEQVSLLIGKKNIGLVLTSKTPQKSFGGKVNIGRKSTSLSKTFQEQTNLNQHIIPMENVAKNIGERSTNLAKNKPRSRFSMTGFSVNSNAQTQTPKNSNFNIITGVTTQNKNIQKLEVKQNTRYNTRDISSLLVGTKQVSVSKQKPLQRIVQQNIVKNIQKEKQLQQQVQQQRQIQIQKQIQRQRQRSKFIVVPLVPMPKVPRFNYLVTPIRRNVKVEEKKVKYKKGRTGYATLPTVFEELIGSFRKGARVKKNITGFESSRFY